MKKLIIDSGATRSRWVTVEDGKVIGRMERCGMNCSAMAMEDIVREIDAALSAFSQLDIEAVNLYMAGVPNTEKTSLMEAAFRRGLPSLKTFELQSDLVAAARALFGNTAGIACILGTGSNSCVWDGERITGHINSGGFILGDEGSAARLGLLFLSDQIKGLIPEEIAAEFSQKFDSSYEGIVNAVYSRGANRNISPSGYLGSLVPFILAHYDHPYIKAMVDGNFRAFFDRCIRRYPSGLPVGISGGFAYACRDIISEVAGDVRVSRIIDSPIEHLR